MTSLYNFTPSRTQAPSFTPTLDGLQYTCTITWNISARRYYLNCSSLDGTLIFSVPICESMPAIAISTLVWDEQNLRILGTTVDEFDFTPGSVIVADIIDCQPTTYNGHGFITVLNNTQFVYPMNSNPGQIMFCGAIEYLISLTKPYFNSTIVYRNGSFEVNP
jgi:hypothetical protein